MLSVRHRTRESSQRARDTWAAALVATVLTTATLGLLLGAMARRATFMVVSRAAIAPPARETITFVRPRLIVPNEERTTRTIASHSRRVMSSAGARAPRAPLAPRDTGATRARVAAPPRVTTDAPGRSFVPLPSRSGIEREGRTTTRPLAPLPGIIGATQQRVPLTEQRVDSILHAAAMVFAEAARRRVPTAAELDERRRSADLDQRLRGRPGLPESAMRGSFSMPSLPGAKARREREAAIVADDRARLLRLVERAKQKRDSMWRADSIARSISVDPW